MNTVIVISGGLDSTTLLNMLVKEDHVDPKTIYPITFDYGQIARKESQYATMNCEELQTNPITYLDITSIQSIFNSVLMSNTKERPDHIDVTKDSDIKKNVVPLRNGVFLTIACIWATKLGHDTQVYYGAHHTDEKYYPDCRPGFVWGFNRYISLGLGMDYNIKLIAPFVNMPKSEVVKLGHKLRVDFTKTWSCYEDGQQHCGKCHSCYERKRAFKLASIYDVTDYGN